MSRWLQIALFVAVGACSPSVPIPPPGANLGALSFTTGPTAGTVVLTGKPDGTHIDALFSVFNVTQSEGVITKTAADGSFMTRPFSGVDGDTMEIFYDRDDGLRSESVCTVLHVGSGLVRQFCQ